MCLELVCLLRRRSLTLDDDWFTVDEVGVVASVAVVFSAVLFGQQWDLEVCVILIGYGRVQGYLLV